ncbi:glycosyltransferase [uncultured Sphingobacterium sp.]|uniref:glycosyltransferase n=1 Tax=uncultured Sphingobacterium sp. TaxID=182688 RepID=UPI00374A3FB0
MEKDFIIYFICPTNKYATGGVKQMYRQVEILNNAGINARILHKWHGNKEKWLENDPPISYNPYIFKQIKYIAKSKTINILRRITLFLLKLVSKKLESNSILVFPEFYGLNAHKITPNFPRVIFNQNCYYTFDHSTNFELQKNTYTDDNTLAVLTVSEDSQSYLKYVFPEISIHKLRLGINDKLFFYSKEKKKQICFMPRKLSHDVAQVINVLRLKGLDNSWNLVAIEDKTEKEVAQIMRESAIFLSFNHREGFGLPPAEAMACGCIVVGYKGRGGAEYFKPDFSYAVEEGDIVGYVDKIIYIINLFANNAGLIIAQGQLASDYILKNYSLDNEIHDANTSWKDIIKKYEEVF